MPWRESPYWPQPIRSTPMQGETRDTHPPAGEPDYAAVARAARRSIWIFYVASIPFWVLVGFVVGYYLARST